MAVFTIPKPEPTSVPSSNRHLPISKTTTFSPGTLIPILCKDILPGDKVKINIDSLIESLPMVAPNLNGYKASFDFYFCPWSNYYGWMDNNVRNVDSLTGVNTSRWLMEIGGTGELVDVFEVHVALRNLAVKPGSLLDYLGYPPGFLGTQSDGINGIMFDSILVPAEKFISLLDIYRNYYVNNQEGYAYFVSGTGDVRGSSDLLKVALSDLDKITIGLRALNPDDDPNVFEALTQSLDESPEPLSITTVGQLLARIVRTSCIVPLGGLPLRTYRMDLNRGIMKETDTQLVSKVSTSDSEFTIDTLRFANKMQKLLDRIDISGGRFSDMMRARWGVTPRNTLNVPDYLGSVSNFFGVTDVISTASGMNSEIENGRGNSVLGQQAGFAVGKVKRDNAPISFRSDQYGTLVCIFSLVPIVTYSQGIELEDLKTSFAQVFDPAFNQLGYQDVRKEELSAVPNLTLPNNPDDGSSVSSGSFISGISYGRRLAWSEYMSSLPRAHGLFAYGQDFDYWVNNRIYTRGLNLDPVEDESDPSSALNSLIPYGDVSTTTYIDPSVQNNLFADVSLTAQNFRLRVNFDIWMRRNVGSRVMPHL